MKSVLIAIKPNWCELIANGIKTIEVRKTRPKRETPFKAYIYQTKESQRRYTDHRFNSLFSEKTSYASMGKVIGEFVCDEIFPIRVFENGSIQDYVCHGMERSCVPYNEIAGYIGYGCRGYGWHISDLVIYDKPRELSDFKTPEWFRDCEKGCDDMERMRCPTKDSRKVDKMCGWCRRGGNPLTRPPQSWCYVESEDTE